MLGHDRGPDMNVFHGSFVEIAHAFISDIHFAITLLMKNPKTSFGLDKTSSQIVQISLLPHNDYIHGFESV